MIEESKENENLAPVPGPLSSPNLSSSLDIPSKSTFLCLICLGEIEKTDLDQYTLSCSHQYCHTCLESYLESNILEGKITLRCFHIENYGAASGDPSSGTDGKTLPACNLEISDQAIQEILVNKPVILAKYKRFSYLKSSPFARECPHCSHLQTGDPKKPSMTCESCGGHYCLTHALAHSVTMSCAAYEQSVSAETQVNVNAIALISKPCPGCGIFISKSDGCNHMKVQTSEVSSLISLGLPPLSLSLSLSPFPSLYLSLCLSLPLCLCLSLCLSLSSLSISLPSPQCPNCQTPFCWICGKAVDDSIFPAHFQWWNLTGCANLQVS
jgi:hypothetical protein